MTNIIRVLAIVAVIQTASAQGDNTVWVVPGTHPALRVHGLAWFEQNEHTYYRLPLAQKEDVPEAVWNRSLRPASARIRFKTNSTSLRLKINHGMNRPLQMENMSPIGAGGIDLYVGAPGQMSFWTTTKPRSFENEYEYVYFQNLEPRLRELTLYLPSYAELAELAIGMDAGAAVLEPTAYERQTPIVFYGTSITQGGCASRGSNGFVSIVERQLNADVINLGFSGSGRAEPIMANIISQIDASLYVVDCVANMNTALMHERYENFVRLLRQERPDIPVLLMTKIHYAREILPEEAAEYVRQNQPVFDVYRQLKSEGDERIFLFDAGEVIPAGGDHPTVDGVHPTDRGFYMLAEALTPKLREILAGFDD